MDSIKFAVKSMQACIFVVMHWQDLIKWPRAWQQQQQQSTGSCESERVPSACVPREIQVCQHEWWRAYVVWYSRMWLVLEVYTSVMLTMLAAATQQHSTSKRVAKAHTCVNQRALL